jgi:ankyrin repeat protein
VPVCRSVEEPSVPAFVAAIQAGDVEGLATILDADPELARSYLGDEGQARSALHIATDWPGHFPRVAATIALLVERGADVNATFVGAHQETPLHWAASSDDVAALDALLAAGADLEAGGGVLTDGSPLDDAVIFGQWNAARRLYEAGARTKLFHAAALCLTDRVRELLADQPDQETVTGSLWHACNAGSAPAVELLLAAGSDPHWLGWNDMTPLQVAESAGHADVVAVIARLG